MAIKRIYVEKKPGYDVAAKKLKADLCAQLKTDIASLRIFLRYDVDGMEESDFFEAVPSVFSEPPVDNVYFEELPKTDLKLLAVEYLPGQFDQRADSAAQCVQLLTRKDRPAVRCATVYAVDAAASDMDAVTKYLVNPVEARVASHDYPKTLHVVSGEVAPVKAVVGFCKLKPKQLDAYCKQNGLAMSPADLKAVQDYFVSESREPNTLEIKVIDTYWSDHCRHTTYLTRLDSVKIASANPHIKEAYADYNELFKKFNGARPEKYPCLMDIATIAAKELRSRGLLQNLDESEEINACSIKVKAKIGKTSEDWLVMFKNETHNHPTEIEPFGGAATCLGGAIRDPLSGRVYVYQAMRVSGSADPRTPIEDTMKGKLPSRVISKTAAHGFSSYGNQIGLATGQVAEMYHPNFAAKRLETGFVVGAAPAQNVSRGAPAAGDVVIVIGGETGRDGCGGATGSSKAHKLTSVDTCGAEVQKGNAPTERKLQRLFRNGEFTRLVKRCNDFGAGGVAVAVGELAAGLDIFLDRMPKKYEGLTATEFAISESQERMAVVVAAKDADRVILCAAKENLLATHVATVTDSARMRMHFCGREVCNLSREFLDSNGAVAHATAVVGDKPTKFFDTLTPETQKSAAKGDYAFALKQELSRLNVCSQQGLGELFDSTIGGGSVLMPYGGRSQLTPAISMAAKLPVMTGETDTATVAAYGCDPYLMSESPFIGAVSSVIDSVAKVVVTGAPFDSIRLTFQEYFMRLNTDPKRWGVPTSALLGALKAQLALGLASIGGKDSMSGSFEKMDVPPTLISFALGVTNASQIVTNVLKASKTELTLLSIPRDKYGMPDLDYFVSLMHRLGTEIYAGNVSFATVVGQGGAYAAVAKSVLSSPELGFNFYCQRPELFAPRYGDVIVAVKDAAGLKDFVKVRLGETTADGKLSFDHTSLTNAEAAEAFTSTLKEVYPIVGAAGEGKVDNIAFSYKKGVMKAGTSTAKPRVLIPVFPGTNCEYDTARQFAMSGAEVDTLVLKNLTAKDVEDSVRELVRAIGNAQILAFPGGFSGGDEPDGSGKLIATAFRNGSVAQAVKKLLGRDGLILGICNGFQALIKLGLLPFGEIVPMTESSATLTFNNINRHVSTIAKIRVSSCMSPWLSNCRVGAEYAVPVSHGEGKFVCNEADLSKMIAGGQVFSQYVDDKHNATLLSPFNPNGSMYAIEGITSPDGRILGKMGHSERVGTDLMKNIDMQSDMRIFDAGVKYYK